MILCLDSKHCKYNDCPHMVENCRDKEVQGIDWKFKDDIEGCERNGRSDLAAGG